MSETQVKPILFKKIKSKNINSVWYVPVNTPNPVNNLHVSYRSDKKGYAGRDIKFPMFDGTVDIVKGPYHVDLAETFYKQTGISLDDFIAEHVLLEE